jgi:60 kDa SS-A/Ro ribonucleoprotein
MMIRSACLYDKRVSFGSLQFPENNVYCLAGFSEKVFDILKLLETDKQALLHEVEKVEL